MHARGDKIWGNLLKRIVVTPRYGLLPEASRIKSAIYKVFAGLFRGGYCSCELLVWRGRSLGTFFNVERRCWVSKSRL